MDKLRCSSWKNGFKNALGASLTDRHALLKNLFLLNLLILALWAFWGIHFSLFPKMGLLLHANPDSAKYIAVSDWIYGKGPATYQTFLRAFLYPLLLGVKFVAGNFGIWLLQIFLLISAINLLAFTIHKMSNRRIVVQGAFLVVALYPTFFFMTFRVMTEALTVFLLCVWLYCSVSTLKKNKLTDSSVFRLIFIAGLLSVTKPVFLPFFIFLVFTMLVIKFSLRRFLLVILSSLPLVCQVGINIHLHNQIVFSKSGTTSINAYFFPRLLAQVRYHESHPGMGGFPEFTHSQKKLLSLEISSWSTKKRLAFLFHHWPQAIKIFFLNIFQENMIQGFGEIPNRFFYYSTKIFNMIALVLHFYMLPVILFIFLKKIGSLANRIWLLLHVSLFISLTLAVGTVFWQRERYVFIMIPLWISLYVHVVSSLRAKIRLSC
ncbi:MAG: hypothetical protein JXI33_06000 [Candidatus Aminicenantes bacterium]|nr:hypothetical protein [Candidatus Aminicenantes bacterium]